MAEHHVPPLRRPAPLAQLNDQGRMYIKYMPSQPVGAQFHPTHIHTLGYPLAYDKNPHLVGFVDMVGNRLPIVGERFSAPGPPTL